MKKLFTIIIYILAFIACSENINTDFESEDMIYFQLNQSTWTDFTDSVIYSFIGNPENEANIALRVMLMGNTADSERQFGIAVNKELSTAIEGVHFQLSKKTLAIPANGYYVDVPITLLKAEDLSSSSRTLVLNLVPSDKLSLGIPLRTQARVIFSNVILKPSNWDSQLLYFFGVWSRVKHEVCLELASGIFADDIRVMAKDQYLRSASALVKRWFKDNYPVYDENNNIIEPW